MAANVRTIEVDAATAEVLEARAAERGVSVAELVANFAAWDTQTWRGDRDGSRAAAEEASNLEELDRRWAAVQAGEPTVVKRRSFAGWIHGGRPASGPGLSDEGVGQRARRPHRFATFLRENHPTLSAVVAREIVAKAQILSEHPYMGRPIAGRPEYRQLVLRC